MKAEIKPRIELDGRTRLEFVIPLSTPYLVFLDPSDICNAHCPWCPSGNQRLLNDVGRHPQLMPFDLYRKIVDDLCAFPDTIKTLRLYKDGEPLLNPEFPEMVEYAKSKDRFGQIDTTTNGLLLKEELSRKIVNAGLTKIFVSVPQAYSQKYAEQVAYLHGYGEGKCKVYVKIIGDHMTEDAKQKFYEDFGDYSDRVFIENLMPCWAGHDVTVNKERGIYNQPLPDKPVTVCPYIFYSMAINSDGTVSLCFLDWRHDMYIGDLKEESAKDVWNGKLLRHCRVNHLRGYKMKVASNCVKCGQLLYGAPDIIDEYANEILKKL